MSTITPKAPTTPAPNDQARRDVPAGSRSGLSFLGILSSEWIKLRSLRSTVWSFVLVIVLAIAVAALMSIASAVQLGGVGLSMQIPAEDQALILLSAATSGVFLGQMIVAILGVISITGEYSTGMIKSTLTAVPRRIPALAAKAIVMFLATFVVGVVSAVASFGVASLLLLGEGLSANLFDPIVLLPLLASALYLALVAVFALGVGAFLRSSAGSIALAVGTLLVLPIVVGMIPADWALTVTPYLLSNAGVEMFAQTGTSAIVEPWQNLLVALGWVAASLVTAALLLKRRDA
ncbi:MAG: ABC transporter permease subunit [Cryobacterium sp.]